MRARFLSLDLMVIHGAWSVSVRRNISSLASVYWSHLSRDSRSMGESFQRRTGSSWRIANRVFCSSLVTENQNLVTPIPESTSIFSNIGAWSMNVSYCESVQNPITRSTPARLYHDRSNRTSSPRVGRWLTYRWKYHWCISVAVGLISATVLDCRMLMYSVNRLIVPPLPAASRPSNTMICRCPESACQRWNLRSSICSRYFSTSYWFLSIRWSYG